MSQQHPEHFRTVPSILLLSALPALIFLALTAYGCGGEAKAPTYIELADFEDELGVTERYSAKDRDVDALVAKGKELTEGELRAVACSSCHKLSGSGANVGPTLRGIGLRYVGVFGDPVMARVWLHHKLHNPRRYWGQFTGLHNVGTMQSMGRYYDPDEMEAIVEYLMSLEP